MTDLMTQPVVLAPRAVLDALARCDLFAALPEAALRALAARSVLRAVRRGERVWQHGTSSLHLGVVAAGRIKCWSPGHDARQWVSNVVRPGGVCGLAPCVDGGLYTCNVEPLERSKIVLVPSTALRSTMEHEPAFARRVAVALAHDVRRLLSVCEDVTLRTPLQRLAHLLETEANGSSVVELRETQTQIASQLGTVREVVGRGFRRLENSGVVSRSGRAVRILQPQELDAIAKNGR